MLIHVAVSVTGGRSSATGSRLEEEGDESLFSSVSVKVWISRDGAVARAELIEIRGRSNEWIRKTLSIWEYDPSGLKIEAPIQ